MKTTNLALCAAAMLVCMLGQQANAQVHKWGFEAGQELRDTGSANSLHLNYAPGEGSITTDDNGTPDDTSDDTVVMGTAGDIVFETGYNGKGQAYRPYYVDASQSATAGAGLTGSGFTSPNQFTIEAIVKADAKTSPSAVNYIFQTRPGSDRGYYLMQDEDNLGRTSIGGLGSIIGNNFGDAEVGQEYDTNGTWIYIAAAIDLTSNPGQAVADIYAVELPASWSAGDPVPVPALVADDRTWGTANPSALAGATGIFGIGNFAIDRNGNTIAEASQEWFQGAIDRVAIYDGLLGQSDLQQSLSNFLVPEPTALGLMCLGGLFVAGRRR